ncbi:DUF3422 family protein [Sphingobium sp. EP60837]|uniref:DUF3422 family protein n=1 Tax=Sphingobium sp. EP60837 TaxID=1855519 RepID=UPI0007DD4818|nr:DUF3422 domain-containing protein [Sphingobium sp. EP60837]ANI80164.1 hypothetical protein EP837_03784 [Sphingobium sp. EP60837]
MTAGELVQGHAPRYFDLPDHSLRAALSTEMHGRKLPAIHAPARLMQVVVQIDEQDAARELERLRTLFPSISHTAEKRFHRDMVEDVHLIWERHTEFSSYMFILEREFDRPFDADIFDVLPPDWFAQLPGHVLRATQIAVLCYDDPEIVEQWFRADDLVHCRALSSKIRFWSDFRLNPDGFGRLLVVNDAASPGELALALQRVQELGNYRNLALLGLPVAQRLARRINALELTLAATTQQIAESVQTDAKSLAELSDLSAEVARIRGESQYRMSATRAYAQMVDDRLRALQATKIDGFESLTDFTERRLLPAARTCLSFTSRLDTLAQSAAWTSDLLRTRIDTELATQNRDLLRSMDRRTALQLRLQRTVEGISVVAITYYACNLLGYFIRGFERFVHLDHDLVLSIFLPVVACCVWLGIRSMHNRLR